MKAVTSVWCGSICFHEKQAEATSSWVEGQQCEGRLKPLRRRGDSSKLVARPRAKGLIKKADILGSYK